jgi:hypothetical protein
LITFSRITWLAREGSISLLCEIMFRMKKTLGFGNQPVLLHNKEKPPLICGDYIKRKVGPMDGGSVYPPSDEHR